MVGRQLQTGTTVTIPDLHRPQGRQTLAFEPLLNRHTGIPRRHFRPSTGVDVV